MIDLFASSEADVINVIKKVSPCVIILCGGYMELSTIIQVIDSEIAKLESVKQLLGGDGPGGNRTPVKRKPGRSAQSASLAKVASAPTTGDGRHRTMSAAARKRIGDAQRARWAKVRKAQKV